MFFFTNLYKCNVVLAIGYKLNTIFPNNIYCFEIIVIVQVCYILILNLVVQYSAARHYPRQPVIIRVYLFYCLLIDLRIHVITLL